MQRIRKAKIVATLGPSSSDETTIRNLFEAGADVFRLNFSHGTHEDHRHRLDTIRKLEAQAGHPIGVLMDLQGPKLRVGKLEDDQVDLIQGKPFRLDLDKSLGCSQRAPLLHPEIFEALEPDAEILLDDGKLRLRVTTCGKDFAETEVMTGGTLKNHKGVNLPGVIMNISPLTEKDRRDLAFGLDMKVDWVAMSFVQRPEDIAEGRKLIGGRAKLLAKIEKPAALGHLAQIIEASDALMVARGDLGVELVPEEVPGRQKEIIRACRLAGKPVVVATQMLESMISAPAPTRAEASDVATAVYDGADAVMLSAESAAGDYPIEAVQMMDRIIAKTESDGFYKPIITALHPEPDHTAPDAISAAAAQVAETIDASAIVSYTTSGSTALRAARERPGVPVLVLTSKLDTARQLAVLWGAHCVHTADVRDFQEMVGKACRLAAEQGLAKSGDRLVITAGVPFGTPGATNVLRIAWVD